VSIRFRCFPLCFLWCFTCLSVLCAGRFMACCNQSGVGKTSLVPDSELAVHEHRSSGVSRICQRRLSSFLRVGRPILIREVCFHLKGFCLLFGPAIRSANQFFKHFAPLPIVLLFRFLFWCLSQGRFCGECKVFELATRPSGRRQSFRGLPSNLFQTLVKLHACPFACF
jgi:hypothetical protein